MAKRASKACRKSWRLTAAGLAVFFVLAVAVAGAAATPAAAGSSTAQIVPGAGLPVGAEVASLRTADSKTFVGANETLVAHVYSMPVNYKDASGAWKPIDNSLVPRADGGPSGVANTANRFQVQLPSMLDAAPVRVSDGSEWVSFSLEGGRGVGTTSGSTETYPAALPGVNVTYTTTDAGLKEDVVLLGPSSPRSLSYTVSTSPGLTATLEEDGSIQFRDASDKPQFSIPQPKLNDALGEDGVGSYQLSSTATGYKITLDADSAWLASPDRAWPVTVDPSLVDDSAFYGGQSLSGLDGYIASAANANLNWFGLAYDKVGWSANGTRRTLASFGNVLPKGAQVLNAKLNLYMFAEQNSTQASVGIYSGTDYWDTTATWNDSFAGNGWTAHGGDFTTEPLQGGSPWATATIGGTLNKWYSWDVTQLVAGWQSDTVPNNGLFVKDVNETTNQNIFQFNSAYASSNSPYIAVTYDLGQGSRPFYSFDDFQLDDGTTASVNEGNGNLLLCQDDLSLPGVAGFGIDLQHCWNSVGGNPHSYSHWVMPGEAVYLDTVGSTVVFHGETGIAVPFTPKTGGGYITPIGFEAVLANSTGTLASPCSHAYAYTLTMNADSSKQYFNSSGQLVGEADRNGNVICVNYGTGVGPSSIVDTGGRTIAFHYTSGNVTSITAPGSCTGPVNLAGSASSTGGSLASNTYWYEVTALTAAGEWTASTEISKTVTGPTGSVALNWTAVTGATSYRIYRGTSSGGESMYYSSSVASFTDTGTTGTSATPPAQSGTCLYYYGYTSGHLSSFSDPTGATTNYGYDSAGNLTSVQDPRGYTTALGLTTANGGTAVASITQPANPTHPTTFTYTDASQLFCSYYATTDITDPDGKTSYYCSDTGLRVNGVTDENGNLTYTDYTDTAGGGSNCVDQYGDSLDDQPCAISNATTSLFATNWTQYGYDSTTGENLVWEQDPTQTSTHRSSWSYTDSSHPYEPTSSTDGNGYTTTYSYYSSGNPHVVTDPYSKTTTYSYYSNGALNQVTDPNSQTTTDTYDASGNLASSTDQVGNVALYGYDGAGNQTSETDPQWTSLGSNPSTKASYTTTDTYDGDGRQLVETDELGNATTEAYDANGNVVRDATADGHETLYSYTPNNQISTETSGLNATTGLCDSGNTCPVTTNTFDAAGNQLTEQDPLGNTTTFGYDGTGNVTSTTDPLGNITRDKFDADGNLVAVIDPLSHETTYGYDASGQLTSETEGLDDSTGTATCDTGDTCPTTTFGYDFVGNQVKEVDGNNRRTTSAYDDNNRLTSITTGLDASGTCPSGHACPKTSYAYDNRNDVLTETKPDSTTDNATFTYYGDGSLHTATDPLGNQTSYTYNPDGTVATKTEPLGTITYGYDNADQLASIAYANATGNSAPATPNVAYGYNAIGDRVSMTTGSSTVYYRYDNNDQTCRVSTTSITSCSGGTAPFGYSYDAAGELTSLTYPDGTSTYYAYTADGQMCLVSLSSSSICSSSPTYTYNADQSLHTTTLGNGDVETRTYTKSGWLNEVKTTDPTIGTVADFSYSQFNGAGEPQSLSHTSTGNPSCTIGYQYDNNERLSGADYASCASSGQPDSFGWTYDANGNWLTQGQTTSGSTSTTTYYPNAGDQITSASAYSGSYSYDGDGNETYDPASGYTYQYDLENRLTVIKCCGASPTSTIASYTYDGEGNRLSQTASGATTNFVWDTNTDGSPRLALEESASGTVLKLYSYGLNRLSSSGGGATDYYAYDGTGSVSNLVSTAGTLDGAYLYNPYGDVRAQTGSASTPMKFAGAQQNTAASATTLYDMGATYDATVGRSLNAGSAGATPSGLSGYAYADDQPITLAATSQASSQNHLKRGDAVSYMFKYAKHRNLHYPKEDIDGGDCTNFTSQVMRSGGWRFYNQGNFDNGWYTADDVWEQNKKCNGVSPCHDPSGLWIRTKGLRTFALKHGRAALASWGQAMKGDMIVYDLFRGSTATTGPYVHAGWDHFETVYRTKNQPSRLSGIWIAQHSPGRRNYPMWPKNKLSPDPSGGTGSSWGNALKENRDAGGTSPKVQLLHVN